MNDPDRPPLDLLTFEKIKVAIHEIDQRHWPVLIEMQVPNYHPLNIPVPPQRPLHFREPVPQIRTGGKWEFCSSAA
jgi:hypothetical protein